MLSILRVYLQICAMLHVFNCHVCPYIFSNMFAHVITHETSVQEVPGLYLSWDIAIMSDIFVVFHILSHSLIIVLFVTT
jgi:hypothetical protein